MKTITLTRGLKALIDDEDYERVSQYTWSAFKMRDKYYGQGWVDGKVIYLHRFIMNQPENTEIDHKDNDGLNCQKDNLRKATRFQNSCNYTRANSAGYRGVARVNDSDKWRAYIKPENGKRLHIGVYDTKEEAAMAYDEAAIKYHGEFATLNFPERWSTIEKVKQ